MGGAGDVHREGELVRRSGLVTRANAGPGELSSAVSGGLGDANVRPGGLSTGKTQNDEQVGRTDAVTLEISTVGGKTEYRLEHKLGRKPGKVVLEGVRNPQSRQTVVVIGWVDRDSWTETTADIYVHLLNGTLDGTILTLQVGGGR